MFSIKSYSRVKQCLVLQHYASSCMAMMTRTSRSVELHPQHRVHHLNRERRSVSSVCHDRRDFHTSSECAGKNLLRKFVNKTKKKLWYETPPQGPPSNQFSALKPPKKRSQEDNMRTRVLNSILYKAITDLLSSPEVNYEVYNYSVDISRVSLPADFSSCRVYWKTSGMSERDDQIQQALDKSSPRIRYLIMAHQTLGGVPPLVFIKDKQYAAMSEVENLLKMADFGPEDGLGEQLHVVESGQSTTSKKPVLFGVDHDALNKQILDYKLRVKDTTSNTLAPELTMQQLEVLADYRKQKIMEKKKKSKRPVDDDITPKEYLLSRHSQGLEREEDDGRAFNQEDDQVRELMAEESRKS
ncbi:putative ribosome-binding factor A, mitochondrial isoform X1 [Oncorhynchus keta]|uniref:putative ribosome-binding factor A, mitochondrial isoform X1 n=1 Tax=Oncorhynchus keta TaxID=8018 RepID=UPI00227AFC0D|nr:putative ribosome-binding factor A, mitochondrial isoform X1 [Oncorhynchus keta]